MKRIIILITTCLLIVPIFGFFNEESKGFFITGGIGAARTSFNFKIDSDFITAETPTEIEPALFTQLKLGYSPDNNIEIYIVEKISWFKVEYSSDREATVSNHLHAFGLNIFLKNKTNYDVLDKCYFGSGFGFSDWAELFEDDYETLNGIGYFIELGYEISKHHRVNLNWMISNPEEEKNGSSIISNTQTLSISYNFQLF